LATKPKHAVIHCGTNDLRTKNPQEITKQMGALCDFIVEKCPDIHITVSSLITRNDDQDKKITEVNTQLQSLCLQKDLSFLLHDNLDKKRLNQSGLHLNKFGDSILAKNVIKTIKRF
jgi:lysophospholipase L1-like esterase